MKPETRRRSSISIVPAGICLILAAVAIVGCASDSSARPPRKADGVPVTVTTVGRKDVPLQIQVIGNVEAYSTITVRAQVGGELTKVYFREGDYVKTGDLLFSIDPRPLQAALNEAEANVAREEAQLSQAKANLARDTAQANYSRSQAARYESLFRQGIISKDQAEQVRSGADSYGAAVNADQAAIESAQAAVVAGKAAVETARVQLGYTTIRSPINGRTGNLAVKQGNLVTANATDLTTINQVQPIYVTFSVPEAQLPVVKKYMEQGKLPVTATPQDDPAAMETGVLTFIDNAVDPTTGTIKLKGTFQNPDRKLWPGAFVRVMLQLTTQPNALVVPSQAIQAGQDGQFVYVVKPDHTVESRPVVIGSRAGSDVVVEKGLGLGETVVTEGQLRLAPGVRVIIRDDRDSSPRPKERT